MLLAGSLEQPLARPDRAFVREQLSALLEWRFADVTARARAWLCSEVERASAGARVADWPSELPAVAGTLALCGLAGLDVQSALLPLASAPELFAEPGTPPKSSLRSPAGRRLSFGKSV